MKLNFTRFCTAGIFLCVLNGQPIQAAAAGLTETTIENPNGLGFLKKSKSKISRNNHAVRIFPDAVRRTMHVVAKDNKGKEIDFFVFDLEGTMIEHLKLESGAHVKLTELQRGKYIYRVFAGDEESASGSFDVR